MGGVNGISEFASVHQPRGLHVPIIDDTIISHLNNVIGLFQALKVKNSEISEVEVQRSIEKLKKVKEALQKINDEVETVESVGSSQSVLSTKLIRDSFEMLRNDGKFTKQINSNGDRVERKLSHASVKNSMKVSPCNFSPKITRKKSFSKLLKSSTKKSKIPPSDSPRIVKTFYATCRINRFNDNSHSFEIMQMKSDNSGDSHATIPEIVFVTLPSGQTTLFKSNLNNSFLNDIPIGDDENHGINSLN